MAYKITIYQKALNTLERRRENANIEAAHAFDEIRAAIPELTEIQEQLSQVGYSISKTFLYSKDKKADMERLQKLSEKLQKKKRDLLKSHGYAEDALQIHYTCSACKDTGFIGDRMCTCQKELLKEMQRAEIRRIAPLEECTFETFDVNYYPEEPVSGGISPRAKAERILESCHRYATGFTVGRTANLMLMGMTGLGKTHLSLAIANVAINRGFSVVYGTAHNLLNDLQNENFGRTDHLRYTENDVLHTDLLIIDDLGTEFSSAYTVACLYNIINTRILAKRPTIINTNYDFQELSEKYDQRITSRIAGEYSALVLFGNDIRYIK